MGNPTFEDIEQQHYSFMEELTKEQEERGASKEYIPPSKEQLERVKAFQKYLKEAGDQMTDLYGRTEIRSMLCFWGSFLVSGGEKSPGELHLAPLPSLEEKEPDA